MVLADALVGVVVTSADEDDEGVSLEVDWAVASTPMAVSMVVTMSIVVEVASTIHKMTLSNCKQQRKV